MKELLFLVHRIPYPPNKGDKIRSFHMLKYLARHYRVHVGTFVDDPQDWNYLPAVRALCDRTCFRPLRPRWATLRSLTGFFTRAPLTLRYYGDRGLERWVRELVAQRPIHAVLVFSSSMAQYLEGVPTQVRRVVDFVDVDSDKWRQYSERHAWPLNALYRREADALLRYEREQASAAHTSIFVSEAEAALFRRCAPESASRVTSVENGVDTGYFTPDPMRPNPYYPDERVLVFTGAMDYWANIDAVTWFATEVFPQILSAQPAARFYIVGTRPTEAVRRLQHLPGVRVTGAVDDVRPYLQHAVAAVAPLRVARGVQNKVLEAMAMAKTVLLTPQALDGLKPWPEFTRLVADGSDALARGAVRFLQQTDDPTFGAASRDYVLANYNWNNNLERLRAVLEGNVSGVFEPARSAAVAART